MDYCMSMLDSLTADELLYAVTLFADLNDKLTIYQSAARARQRLVATITPVGACQMGRMNQAGEVFQRAGAQQRSRQQRRR